MFRCRPENTRELGTKDSRNVVQVVNDNTLIFDPLDPAVSRFGAMSLGKRNKNSAFEFDAVFDHNSTQEQVYNVSTAPLLAHALQGYNASVFAYGATGAGKTHTMIGNSESGPGVMILALKELYQEIEKLHEEEFVKLSISYLEVYNELIRDLLSDTQSVTDENVGNLSENKIGNDDTIMSDIDRKSQNLELCEDSGQVTIRGLSWHQPSNLEDLLKLLEKGNTYRTRSATDANALSSRSHAVLQIHIEIKSINENGESIWKLGKLSLIDLAGSERASVSRNCGERQKEGANINRSLLALGNCINALCQNKKKAHIPYRDSKLTRLLKDSLGGSCKTVMIANISPSSLSYDDTHNTLKYADRAKNIKSKLTKNTTQISHSTQDQEISTLRLQLAQSQKQLKEALISNSNRIRDPNVSEEVFNHAKHLFSQYKDKIEKYFCEIKKLKNQQTMSNKTERKLVQQVHKIQGLNEKKDIHSLKSIENQINEIHEENKNLLRSIEQWNGHVRSVYQEIEESNEIEETQRSYLFHEIQLQRVLIEKQDLVDLCSSKDCKLQLLQQKIQELERNLSLYRVSRANNTSVSSLRNKTSTNRLPSSVSHTTVKNVPSRVLRENLSKPKPSERSISKPFKSTRVRSRSSVRSTIKSRRPSGERRRNIIAQRKTVVNSRPRFTFTSPPKSFVAKRVEQQKNTTNVTNVDNSAVINDSNDHIMNDNGDNDENMQEIEFPSTLSTPCVPKNIVNDRNIEQTPLNAPAALAPSSLKLTSLSSIASPPRRVRKRKQKNTISTIHTGGPNVEQDQSNILQSPPLATHSRPNTNFPLSISQQLSALKEKRASEIARRKAEASSNQVECTPIRAPLRNSTNATTPLPFLKPGTLRKPSISLMENSENIPN